MSNFLRRYHRLTFPTLNVHRGKESVAIDTIYSDNPAIVSGATQTQSYCVQESLVYNVFEMKIDKKFVSTLEYTIRQRGYMDKLLSDSVHAEITG